MRWYRNIMLNVTRAPLKRPLKSRFWGWVTPFWKNARNSFPKRLITTSIHVLLGWVASPSASRVYDHGACTSVARWSGSHVPRWRLSPSFGHWSSPLPSNSNDMRKLSYHEHPMNLAIGASRPLVLDCETTFHPDYGDQECPSTPLNNLWNLIYLAAEEPSDTFEFTGAIQINLSIYLLPVAEHHRPLAGTHCAYPRRDGQAELIWEVG